MRFDAIHNYYEPMVVRRIMELLVDDVQSMDEDHLQDIACIALNQLPARYVRHDVDMAFFLTSDERQNMDLAVDEAVRRAIKHIKDYPEQDKRPETINM